MSYSGETSMETQGGRHKWSFLDSAVIQNILPCTKCLWHLSYKTTSWRNAQKAIPFGSSVEYLYYHTSPWWLKQFVAFKMTGFIRFITTTTLSDWKLDKNTWFFNITQGKRPLTERKVCFPIKLLHTRVWSGTFHDT